MKFLVAPTAQTRLLVRRAGWLFAALMWLGSGARLWAQPDYPPALWNQAYPGHWYTTGNARDFVVIHDMEGYYLSVISYFQQAGTQASAHYCINGLENGSDSSGHIENRPNDSPAGEITQMVRENYWAWHVRCWNRFTLGTEHEGFVNNPAWYTEAMYRASAALQRHLCETWNIPKDRNHIIGHNQWQNAAWVSWMRTNYPAMDPTCNDHTDPGQFWDWSHFMSLITNLPAITGQPEDQTVDPGAVASFSVAATGEGPLSYQWRRNATDLPGATGNSCYLTNVQLEQAGDYSVVVSNLAGAVTSSNAALTVRTAPMIIAQPINQNVPAGRDATFAIEAIGSAPLSFQWRFHGTNLPGANGSDLTIQRVRQADSGDYSVLVTNAFGSASSSNADLTVAFLAAWGEGGFDQTNVPTASTNVIAVAAGAWHSLALRADGIVVAWGSDWNGQCEAPAGLSDAVAVAAGGYHSLAIKADGTVAAWGANDYGQSTVPASLRDVLAVAAGTWHSLALRSDGTLAAWGDNSSAQLTLPAGLTNIVAIAAGGNHSLALRADGIVLAWGQNTDSQGNFAGQSLVPANAMNVVAVAAGDYHSLALRTDGSLVAWGDNSEGQCLVPAGLSGIVAVAAGAHASLALRNDGSVAFWGANPGGQETITTAWTNVAGIAAGNAHAVVLLEGYRPVAQALRPALVRNRFSTVVQTMYRRNYELEFKDAPTAPDWLPGQTRTGNGALRLLADTNAPAAQRLYRVRQW